MSGQWELLWRPPFGTPGVVLVLTGAAVILVLGLLSTAGRPVWVRGTIGLCRLVAVTGVLLLLWRPVWRVADVTRGRDHVAVIQDLSASMALPGARTGSSRLEDARALLRRGASTLRDWQRRYSVDRYHYHASLQRAEEPAAAGAKAEGRSTRLLKALTEVRARYHGRRLAGVVVISDGQDTGALRDGLTPALASRLRGLDVPVNVVPIESPALVDVSVARVLPDDLAFVRNVARVRVQLRVSGIGSRPVLVSLRREGQVVQTRTAEGSSGQREVVFEIVPERVGTFVGEVTAQPLPGEATRANNTRRFVLKVVRDRVRVLQIAGRPSWDVRFLRQHLKRDPNVDLVSFFILRTHLDATYALPGELSLIEFPVHQLFSTHLDSFDLIVMQDFERYPPAVGVYLDNIARYVRRGGALALLGGENTLSRGGFTGSRFAKVLPVKLLLPGPAAALLSEEPFRPQWTPAAEHHPITRARGLPALSTELLSRLPRLEGVNRVARAVPDAVVLAVHPRLRNEDGRPATVLAVREVDKGRVLALLTDTSWLWRFAAAGAGDASAYDAFWKRAVRYLLGDPEFARLRVVTRHHPYPAGTPFRISVLATDFKYRPHKGVKISYRVLRSDRRPEGQITEGSGTTGESGALSVQLSLDPGSYRLEAKAVLDGRSESAQGVFVTEGQAPELAVVAPNPSLLRAVARETGGRVLRAAGTLEGARFHPPRIVRIDNLRTRPLVGSAWLLWALLALALTAEWLLRRRFALV
ncbi:MAG: hypothetical protein ABI333_18605 [bacterium]